MNAPRFGLTPIGSVESPLTDAAAAPKQGDEGAPDAWLTFDPAVVAALDGLEAGDDIVVLTWLHRARRDVLHQPAARGWRRDRRRGSRPHREPRKEANDQDASGACRVTSRRGTCRND